MPVHLSVCLQISCPKYFKDLNEIWHWDSTLKVVRQFDFVSYWSNTIPTLQESQMKFITFLKNQVKKEEKKGGKKKSDTMQISLRSTPSASYFLMYRVFIETCNSF
jgi:hypothetical protein